MIAGGKQLPADIAITGLSCAFAQVSDLSALWESTVSSVDLQNLFDKFEQKSVISLIDDKLTALINDINSETAQVSIVLCAGNKQIKSAVEQSGLLNKFSSNKLDISIEEIFAGDALTDTITKLKSGLIDIGIVAAVDESADEGSPGFAAIVLNRIDAVVNSSGKIYAVISSVADSHNRDASLIDIIADTHKNKSIDTQTIRLLETNIKYSHQNWDDLCTAYASERRQLCAVDTVDPMLEQYPALQCLILLLKAVLSVYQRAFSRTNFSNKQINLVSSPFYASSQSRPWIHPSYLNDSDGPRRAAVAFVEKNDATFYLVIQEPEFSQTGEDASFLRNWDSELCIMDAVSPNDLLSQMQLLEHYLLSNEDINLRDIAYTFNLLRQEQNHEKHVRLAIVSKSVQDLLTKLKIAGCKISSNSTNAIDGISGQAKGIYYSPAVSKDSKLAFVLPGLGAAYPNMLFELCLNFPEVRWVFDFVDRLAFLAHEKTLPSKLIFPETSSSGDTTLSVAALAAIDSAVTIVLMAEWALFAFFENLNIKPDALIGCSTGEFAAITMGGAIEILSAASTFYKLSTNVAKSIPKDKLLQLSSVKIDASYKDIAEYINDLGAPLYLTADLAPQHLIVSGYRSDVTKLIDVLRKHNIDVQLLPIAIPYHTPLVEGVIKVDQDEIRSLSVQTLEIAAWSCSTAAPYPANSEEIRQITTDLFTKPIYLRQTIEDAYNSGLHNFIELGPRGTLTGLIRETLQGRPHIALAADVPNSNSITHLHHVLAKLSCSGVSMNLDYIYKRRAPRNLIDLQLDGEDSGETDSSESYNLLEHNDLYAHKMAADEVVANYLISLESFHSQVIKVQQNVMNTYLTHIAETNNSSSDEIMEFLFLKNAAVDYLENEVIIRKQLKLSDDLYLLDHCIGGNVSSEKERVYLMPLMVALEIMCEAASALSLNTVVLKIENVRAFRRIRVDDVGFELIVHAKKIDDAKIKVEIKSDAILSNDPLMSCEVIFGISNKQNKQTNEAEIFAVPASRMPKLQNDNLYGRGAMFHGPRMQSVLKLTRVGEKRIEGIVAVRNLHNWFAFNANGNNGSDWSELPSLIDPLLLDNASQLVLYYLYEEQIPVAALLPFYIESIEFFNHQLIDGDVVTVQSKMLSVTNKGTQADLDVVSNDGQLAVRINNISSRLIALPPQWQKFIDDPMLGIIGTDLSKYVIWDLELKYESAGAIVYNSQMPEDDGVLDWCSDYVLSRSERQIWNQMSAAAKRKREWIMGRIAAKETVARFYKNIRSLRLADIEILQKETGAPYAHVSGLSDINISIAHTADVAVAIASNVSAGIDIEKIQKRDDDFEDVAFTNAERQLFQKMSPEQREIAVTKFWCGKESLVKAIGLDFVPNLQNIEVMKENNNGSELLVKVHKNEEDCQEHIVRSAVIGDHVIALALCR